MILDKVVVVKERKKDPPVHPDEQDSLPIHLAEVAIATRYHLSKVPSSKRERPKIRRQMTLETGRAIGIPQRSKPPAQYIVAARYNRYSLSGTQMPEVYHDVVPALLDFEA
ncbi:hypothetical protein PG997_011956 [Apiospora hydei]|uniref:Uncharacterized protein n=1 Tax=Apiospora hydei TaxID=1337664 RepID=A0ABR1V585_9PEZI